MKPILFAQWLRLGVGLVAVTLNSCLWAAQIPNLFNTGVDAVGAPLANDTVDPHYTLIESPDAAYPGPTVRTLKPGFPVGPWFAEGPNSRWVAPQGDQNAGNAPGRYVYRTTFDLTGYDAGKAVIYGKWAADNSGVDIVVNGLNWGIANNTGFGSFGPEFIIDGAMGAFIPGTNTLDFLVNNAGDANNPTGLRVEMTGVVELPGEAPTLSLEPIGANAMAGSDVSFRVIAGGTAPLAYQWFFGVEPINGAVDPTLTLTGVTADQGGEYKVVVTNNYGRVESQAVWLQVLLPIPGLFDTGVGEDGMVLVDLATDPHYVLMNNADNPQSTDTFVQNSTVFPIVSGPWVANTDISKWIGPRGETSGAAAGDYIYRFAFDLTGLDPFVAFLSGQFTGDDQAQILLNGSATGILNSSGFGGLTSFTITNNFKTGMNFLEFKVNNGALGYTGLRVQGLQGGAKKQSTALMSPRVVTQPTNTTVLVGDTVTLTVVADGTPVLTYQWKRGSNDLTGKTESSLVLSHIQLADAGNYSVIIRNGVGVTNSQTAMITVLEPIAGLFSTGVGTNSTVLEDGAVDPHYVLVQNNDTVNPVTIPPEAAANLVAHWTFEEGLGASSPSVVGNWTGVFDGNPAPDTYPVWVTDDLGPVTGGTVAALRFNAGTTSNSVVTSDYPGLLGQTPRTVMAWIKWGRIVADFDGTRSVIASWGDPASDGGHRFTFRLNDTAGNGTIGALRLEIAGGWGTATTDLRDGRWHHVAVVHAEAGAGPQQAQFYVDGRLDARSASGGSTTLLDTTPGDPVTIGAGGPGLQALGNYGFNGWIDDVRIYTGAVVPQATGSPSQETIVQDSTVFPIVAGPWLPNTSTTKWIGPRKVTTQAAGGTYIYRTTLDLQGYDPASVQVFGKWSMDNTGVDILINGVSSGAAGNSFTAFVNFVLLGQFTNGLNTIDFVVLNADPGGGYTGLMVDALRAGGNRVALPKITSITRNGSQVNIQWTGGGRLQWAPSPASPAGSWTDIADDDGSYQEILSDIPLRFFRVAR
jgi:hypothetical protein